MVGDAGVPEAFFDDLQVRASGEQPCGVRMSQVVHPHGPFDPGRRACWLPHLAGEPVAGQVPVAVHGARLTSGVLARRIRCLKRYVARELFPLLPRTEEPLTQ